MIVEVRDQPPIGMLIVLLALAGWLGGLRLAQQRNLLRPEHARKLFHVGAGAIVLGFPWLFHDLWPVVGLAVLTIPALLSLKHVPALRVRLGSVLYAVKRNSLGEVSFALAAVLLFAVAAHRPLLYTIPLMILTLADSAAAVVGAQPGRHRYQRVTPEKSLEGSLAFLLVASAAALLLLWLTADKSPLDSMLLALATALIVTACEALTPYGLDNLTIPVAGYLVLRLSFTLSTGGQGAVLCVALFLAGLCLCVLAMPQHTGEQLRHLCRTPFHLHRTLPARRSGTGRPGCCRRRPRGTSVHVVAVRRR